MSDDLHGNGVTEGIVQDPGADMQAAATPMPTATAPVEPPPAPAAKRGGRKLLIGLLIGALALCVLVGGIIAVGVVVFSGQADRAGAVFDQYNEIGEGLGELDSAAAELDAAAAGDEAEAMTKFAEAAAPVLEEAARDLDKAISDAEGLDDSPSKEALVEVGVEAKAALKAAQAVMAEAKKLSEVMSLVSSATAEYEAAADLLGSSVDNSNHKKWAAATKDAEAGKKRMVTALRYVDQLAALRKDLDVAAWRAIFVLERDSLVAAGDAAAAGARGNVSAYNKAIDRYNHLGTQAKDAEVPEWLEGDEILLGEMYDQSEELMNRVIAFDEAMTRAEERLNSGQY